jgi:uncharacterized protein
MTSSSARLSDHLSIAAARRLALAAQGFARPRPQGRVDARHARRVFDHVGLIQIDSVNVLVRSQELPLFARLGPHPRRLIPDATAAGELFEYWGHEASHIPVDQYRLFRWKMDRARAGAMWSGLRDIAASKPHLVTSTLARITDEGAVVAGDLSTRTAPKGTWWDWDDAKAILEYLFWVGDLSARRRPSDFARVYDLPERIIPAEHLHAPVPDETDARKQLLMRAARALGVATANDLADYHRQKVTAVRPLLTELVEDGRLQQVRVQGWGPIAYLDPTAKRPRTVEARALLSPFDSLVWNRDRDERLFDFTYRIEIYTPQPKRRHGYYVLPFLLGDRIVARVDLKADRANRTLMVPGAFVEDHVVDRVRVVGELAAELRLLAGWLELEQIDVGTRGDLARPLKAAVARAAAQ